jgi:Kef-type K+ transport system membrane component KefB/nucleotide-binding universal stress UspA family protein
MREVRDHHIARPALLWLAAPLLGLASTAAWAAERGTKGPSEDLFVAEILLLMLVGRLLGEAMLRIGQPGVMGPLIAGLVLGPSLFGLLLPNWHGALFPKSAEQKAMIDAVSQFGVLLLLLLTGLETDLKLVRQTGWAAISASLFGIVIPFGFGIALGAFIPDSLLDDPAKRLVTALFLGTALSIASVKIVATVVGEMNFLRRTVGQVILASAIIDDTVGWMITAVIFSLAQQGHVDIKSVAMSLIGTAAFMTFSFTAGRRLVFIIIRWVNDTFASDFAVITAILLIMCAMALITDAIGVHTVLGAFVAGILVGESPILTKHIDEQLRGLIFAFFMPIFFGTAGLSADLTILKDPTILALTAGLIAIASIGKFGGASLGGWFGGLTQREALALGCGMNARGSTEVIVATIGLSMGALSQSLFTMIVAMAVITTMAMPPSLRWALKRIPLRKNEKQWIEREEMEERGFVPKLERLLVAADGSANGEFAVRIAGIIAGTKQMPTTVMQIKNGKSNGKADDAKEDVEAAKQEIEETAEQADDTKRDDEKTDAKIDVTTIIEKKPTPKAIAEEAEKGYSLMIIGLEKTVARGHDFHGDVTKLADGFDGPLVVTDARDGIREDPRNSKLSILVPVNGTELARRAAEVAIAMARATNAPLTALYVAQTGKTKTKRARHLEEAILKDISKLAETYDTGLRTAVRAEMAADDAILKEITRRKHNLVVMGVGRRPGEKLFFGETAAALLEKSECSLLFVAS